MYDGAMLRLLGGFFVLSLAVATAACHDKDAYLSGPQGALAVGAYHRITYGDACSGGGSGKVPMPDFCSAESITDLLELSSSDPSVAEIIAATDDPRGAGASVKYAHSVVGKKPGQSTLRFKGRFSDGSVRETAATIQVKAPDSVKLAAACGSESPVANLLAFVDALEGFDLEIYAGNEELAGWLPNAVTADGVTQSFDEWDGNPYLWQAPSTPVVLNLQSVLVAKVTGTLTAFGPDQVTGIVLDSCNQLFPAAYVQPGDFCVGTAIVVNGQVPCHNLPVELHTSTPDVCSGPAGETVWAGNEWGGSATTHGEGTCTIGVSMPGGSVLATKSFPIFFVTAPPSDLDVPGFGSVCTVEGGTACGAGFGDVGLCKSGRWVEKVSCPAQQVCDFVPDTTPGCTAGLVCAQCRGLR